VLLSKHHGLGNDFLVALDERNRRHLGIDGDAARRLCDRRRGIGADGLVHGAAPTDEQAANGIDVVMHLFNSDGSRAEMSGNGIRCLGQAVARRREPTGTDGTTVAVLTDAGRRTLIVTDGGPGGGGDTVDVSVGMGRPGAGPHIPEALDEFFISRHGTVDMGNPHLVVLVSDPGAVQLATEGAWLEKQFPHGINVEYIALDDTTGLQLRVWERGAGVTEACGTGACAAAFLAHRWGLVGDDVQVSMPGGAARVRLEVDGSVTLIGPSAFVADVDVQDEMADTRTPAEA
jgi:diaminopimelate epimerase